jgi:hypothetical protein
MRTNPPRVICEIESINAWTVGVESGKKMNQE